MQAKSSVGETQAVFNVVVSPPSRPLKDVLGSNFVLGGTFKIQTPSATSPWIVVNGTLSSGSQGAIAQSGTTPDKGTSLLQLEYRAPSSSRALWSLMTFWWRSDTEPGKDIVQCKVDGLLAKDSITGKPLALSGQTGWSKQSVLIPGAGTRRIEFVYTKDANLRSDVDRVWVSDIDIGQPPVIKTSPVASLRVVPPVGLGSGTFSLTAEVTGAYAGASGLTWWKDGVALTNGTSSSKSILSGVNTGTLTVTNASAADAGAYWIVARNDSGTAVSRRSEVVVSVPPSVTSQPVAPLCLKIGEPLILTAVVSGAKPMFFQWKKDGVPGRWSSTPNLTIFPTTAASAGKYVLVAVNPSGTVTSNEVSVSFSQPASNTSVSTK
jgi:hypothetical protein